MLQIIALVAYLKQERRPAGPFMVVVPSSLIANWEQEFRHWAPSLKLVSYKGTADARAALFTQQVGSCTCTVALPSKSRVGSEKGGLLLGGRGLKLAEGVRH